MPARRLPVVPDRRARSARRTKKERKRLHGRRARCPSRRCKRAARRLNVYMMGIGGTGVVTVNQILGTAALLDGKHVRGPRSDRAQPEGRAGGLAPQDRRASRVDVVEQGRGRRRRLLPGLRPAGGDRARRTSITRGAGPHDRRRVDQPGADRRDGARTRTCTSPTGGGLHSAINRVTRKDENVYLDALGLAEALFDDHMAANMILLGAAYQAGALPVSRRGHRGSHPAQRRVGGDEHPRVPARAGCSWPIRPGCATIKRHRLGAARTAPRADARGAGAGRPGRRRRASCGACSRSACPS